MKIVILRSSPHLHGTSNTLVDEFKKGAIEAHHEIVDIDLARSNLHPCLACDRCFSLNKCVQNDDGNYIINQLLNSDMIVMASPIYYYNVSAQLKTLIDRFYARSDELSSKHLKFIAILTSWDADEEVMHPVKIYFDKLCKYMHFEDVGRIYGKGCGNVKMIDKHYYQEAYNLGKDLK